MSGTGSGEQPERVALGPPDVRPHPRYRGWMWLGLGLSPATSPAWRDRLVSAMRWQPQLRPVGIEPLISTAFVWIVCREEDLDAALTTAGACVERANGTGDRGPVRTGAPDSDAVLTGA